jgi:hypothetical protein
MGITQANVFLLLYFVRDVFKVNMETGRALGKTSGKPNLLAPWSRVILGKLIVA